MGPCMRWTKSGGVEAATAALRQTVGLQPLHPSTRPQGEQTRRMAGAAFTVAQLLP